MTFNVNYKGKKPIG